MGPTSPEGTWKIPTKDVQGANKRIQTLELGGMQNSFVESQQHVRIRSRLSIERLQAPPAYIRQCTKLAELIACDSSSASFFWFFFAFLEKEYAKCFKLFIKCTSQTPWLVLEHTKIHSEFRTLLLHRCTCDIRIATFVVIDTTIRLIRKALVSNIPFRQSNVRLQHDICRHKSTVAIRKPLCTLLVVA